MKFALFGILTIAGIAPAQPLPQFEVATIKPFNEGHRIGIEMRPGARVVIGGVTLNTLISIAYDVPYRDISGTEEWMEKDRNDVEAQPSEGMQITNIRHTLFTIDDPRLRQMLQALLIDRFQLRVRLGTKNGDVYFLERNGKSTPMKENEILTSRGLQAMRDSGYGEAGYAGGQWSMFDTTMPDLAKHAADYIFREAIVDRTGLTGRYSYRERAPDIDPTYGDRDQRPSFRDFLTEMGLKLERGKAPVETLVIDSASKPSAN